MDLLSAGPGGIKVFRNDGNGIFTVVYTYAYTTNAPAVIGDFDNDGYLDFAVAGGSSVVLFRNMNIFESIPWSFSQSNIAPVTDAFITSGDIDNNGKLDLIVSGTIAYVPYTFLLLNEWSGMAPSFTVVQANLLNNQSGTVSMVDLDGDGGLDVFRTSYTDTARTFRHLLPAKNTKPGPPTGLAATHVGDTVVLSWKKPADANQAAGFTYNVYVDSSGGRTVLSDWSDRTTGFHRSFGRGNAGADTSWRVVLEASGSYVWSVQSIDHSYAGSLFASADTIQFTLVSVEEGGEAIPVQYALLQNYPNPFNPSTVIRYAIPERSRVRLRILDLLGRVVQEFPETERSAGFHGEAWSASNASGVYFYQIEAVSIAEPGRRFNETKKMILLK